MEKPSESTPSNSQKRKLKSLRAMLNYYRDFAPDYDAVYEESYWKLYDDLTWHLMEPYLPKNTDAKILDIGGGTAKWAIPLAKRGYHVLCADLSEEMLHIAKQKVKKENLTQNIQFQQLDIRNMDSIQNDGFDLVLALGDVISYALDDDLAVSEMFRVCKPEGLAIASVDNKAIYIMNYLKNEHFDEIDNLITTGLSYFFSKHPVKSYFPEDLQILFRSVGFEILEIAGKPVVTASMPKKVQERKLDSFYEKMLELELKFARNPHFIGFGGHLQITVKKNQAL